MKLHDLIKCHWLGRLVKEYELRNFALDALQALDENDKAVLVAALTQLAVAVDKSPNHAKYYAAFLPELIDNALRALKD